MVTEIFWGGKEGRRGNLCPSCRSELCSPAQAPPPHEASSPPGSLAATPVALLRSPLTIYILISTTILSIGLNPGFSNPFSLEDCKNNFSTSPTSLGSLGKIVCQVGPPHGDGRDFFPRPAAFFADCGSWETISQTLFGQLSLYDFFFSNPSGLCPINSWKNCWLVVSNWTFEKHDHYPCPTPPSPTPGQSTGERNNCVTSGFQLLILLLNWRPLALKETEQSVLSSLIDLVLFLKVPYCGKNKIMCLISETWCLICLGSHSPGLGWESRNTAILINTSSARSLEKSIIYLTIFLNPSKFMCILAWSDWLPHAVTVTTGPHEALGKTVLFWALTSPLQSKISFYPVTGIDTSCSVPSGAGRI